MTTDPWDGLPGLRAANRRRVFCPRRGPLPDYDWYRHLPHQTLVDLIHREIAEADALARRVFVAREKAA